LRDKKWDEIEETFLKYRNPGSNVEVGLRRRRQAEADLFLTPVSEVLNVKILRIVSKLCIGIGDTKFDQLMTLFSIDNGFYLGKTQRL
jgi:hypothetical protein